MLRKSSHLIILFCAALLSPHGEAVSLWNDATIPATVSANDTSAVEVGVKFTADLDGFVTGLRFYKGPQNTGTHVGHLWRMSDGALLTTVTFTGESASGWQQVTLPTAVAVTANTTYVASYHAPVGRYAFTSTYFTAEYAKAPLRGPASGASGGNGVYKYGASGSGVPTQAFNATNYWVDVVFATGGSPPPDTTPPTVSGVVPAAGATGVNTAVAVKATFSESMTAGTITGSTFDLRNAANVLVAGGVSYDGATRTATLTPTAPLAINTTYTATVHGGSAGVKDAAGNALAADFTWTFTTATSPPPPQGCPCSLWNDATTPATVSANDTSAVEVGVKFTADLDGFVTGLRFYKGPQNTGTHVGHLWRMSDGALLTTVTFTGESASGWQQVTLPTAVAVTANTTYVASYHAPVGRYAFTSTYFTAEYAKAPLRGPASGASGGNGVYKYGASGSGVPTQAFNATNYWVDVVFATGGSPPPDTTPPTVSGVVPAAGATGVNTAVAVKATFSESMTAGTITGSTFDLRNAANVLVAGGVSYDGATRTATLTPTAPLAINTTYTATVHGGSAGVKDAAGNALAADFTWTFTTATSPPPPQGCPCSLWNDATLPATVSANDPNAVELGVKFRADLDGFVTGLRFYKGPQNTGSHVGHLWTSTGTLLASVTFTVESASGWQQVTLPTAVAVTANTTYVASYHAPVGRYAFTSTYFTAEYAKAPLRGLASGASGGNGVYKYGASGSGVPTQAFNATNYWVDVVFDTTPPPPDTTPPTVSGVVPAAGATGVNTAVAVKATFSESMTAGTITGSTFELRNAANALVAGGVSYDGATRTATLTPTAPLASNTTYTATVHGGSAGVKDAAGNALAADFTWTFTTSAGAGPALVGQWAGPFAWPFVAVHMMLLRTGEILVWEGEGSASGGPTARLWNPATGTFTAVPTGVNIWCAGHSLLADGKVMVVGGHVGGGQAGTFEATIFNPSTRLWTSASPMTFARWYPTATTLPDGRVLATSGSDTCEYCYVPVPELYDPTRNTWTQLTSASLDLPFYSYMFVLPDGRVVNAGSFEESLVTRVLNVQTQTWTVVDPVAVEGGSAVMYLPGKIMKSGSSVYTASPAIPAADTTYVLNMTGPPRIWRQTAPMTFPRANHNTTLLPDGTALVIGGQRVTNSSGLDSTQWVYEAELLGSGN